MKQEAQKSLGREGEALAAEFLVRQGYRILERNYRCCLGEIDLIAEKGGDLFFVEVKSRRSLEEVSPFELISDSKQRHLSRVALHYVACNRFHDRNGSFALVAVDYSGPRPQCELVLDIFDLQAGY